MITLYQFGNSVCCQKVRITLCEKGLPWETVEVNLFRNEQYSPAYLKLNPKGLVPTLVHDGRHINESTLICEYLDDVFPTPSLIPADPLLRTRMRAWSKVVDEGLHEGISEISFSAMFRERLRSSTPEEREIRFRNIGDPRRRDRFFSTYEQGTRSPFVRHAVAAYSKAFASMEAALQQHGPWLIGAMPTLADINMMPYVARLHYLGLLDIWTDARPAVRAWWTRVQAWPSFVEGIVKPLTTHEADEMGKHGPTIYDGIRAVHDDVADDVARAAHAHL